MYVYICSSFQQCPTTVKRMSLISLPPFICDLFPLINLRLILKRVIALIENGFSASEAGRRCHVPLKTVQRWTHKFKNYRECQRRYSTGRPRCSTREENEAVRRVDQENSFRSANQIRTAANFPGSFRTVMNRLRDANSHYWRAVSKEGLTDGLVSCRPPSLRNRLEAFRLGKRNLQ